MNNTFTFQLLRLALHLLDKVSDKVLSSKSCLLAVLNFLEAFPPFSKRIDSKLFRRVSVALEGCQLWSSLLVFLEQCVHLWSSLPKCSVCRPLELVVEQEGVSSTVVRLVELLTKGQKSSLSVQVKGCHDYFHQIQRAGSVVFNGKF